MGGEDVKVSVELSFMEAVQGCVKMFIILTDLSCETCVSVSKRFFCKGWKTSPNRAHRCKDKGTKGYKGGRCSSYFKWKSSIHSRFGLKNINVQTQSGFVPIDEHVRVIDGNGKLVSHTFLYVLSMMLLCLYFDNNMVFCGPLTNFVYKSLSIPAECSTHPEISMVGLT
ncbi:hypothetical protein ACS0TY_023822 [Phlomoides rotata]